MVRLETAPTVRKIGQIGLIGYKTAKNAAIERLRARQRDVHQMPDLVSS